MANLLNPYRFGGAPITAKSVIFDIADNHGFASNMGLRRAEFYNGGVIVDVYGDGYSAYATTEFSATYAASYAFNNFNASKTGGHANTTWVSANGVITNQRLIVVFDVNQTFDEIVTNNAHISGGTTTLGIDTTTITASTDAIVDTTYNAAISNSTVLASGISIPEHIAADTADDQTVWTA